MTRIMHLFGRLASVAGDAIKKALEDLQDSRQVGNAAIAAERALALGKADPHAFGRDLLGWNRAKRRSYFRAKPAPVVAFNFNGSKAERNAAKRERRARRS